MTTAAPTFSIQRASERAHADHGWLDAYHSFSFADYFDPQNLSWGALRVFNDDTIAAGTGFPVHPHKDMEILTYVFEGELAHKDSMGNAGVVRPGGVQFMSAGTGVRHSEYNARKDVPLHLVQMWILPGQLGTAPTYGQMDFTIEDRRDRWLIAASGDHKTAAPIRLTQNATLALARLEGATLDYPFAPKRYAFAFVGDGDLELNGEPLAKGDAARLYDIPKLEVKGTGELVLWDLPAVKES